MLDIDGNLSETSAHNLFLVIDGKLCTPIGRNVLGGITKAVIFELAGHLGIEIVEGDFTPYDLYNAEEAFLASASKDASAEPSTKDALRLFVSAPSRFTLDGCQK
jgi:branched-chain amino acid aminotransferase